MGNPITPPAPSATPATAVMHTLLAEFQPSSLPAPAPGTSPAAPAGNSDIPGLPAVTQPAVTQPAAAAEPEFDLAALGISTEESGKDSGGELTEAIDPATTRGKQIWADHKLVRALELPPDQGGLGYRPTLTQITDMAKDSRALNNLVMDLQAKDKTANIAAMNHLLQLAPTAFLDLAQNLPPAMKEMARQRIVGEEVQALLEVARKFPETDEANKKYRQYWFQVANGLHYALTGGKSLDPQVLYQTPKPAETATENLQRREQELAQREQAIERQRFDSWKADTVARREKSIRQMVELVVKPVKASPTVKALAVDAIVARTLDQLRGQTGLMDQVTMLLRKAETQLANDDAMAGLADQIVDLYIRGASPIIRRQVAESVKNSTDMAAVTAEADAAKAKQASGDPTPAGSPTAPGGAPQTGQSNGGVRAREKGETDQKYIQSVLGQVLRS